MRRVRYDPTRLRVCAARDDRGSMAMLLIVSMVGLALSALLIPMVIDQDRSTRFTTSRLHALDAARAGIDAVLGRIREAVDSADGSGDSGGLPCGPLSGPVNSTGAAAYTVNIGYYTSDPSAAPNLPAMRCVSGYGTYEPGTGAFTPSYARLTSTGTDGPATNGASSGRTLISTYVFKTSNTNVPGGVIRIYPATSGPAAGLCLDAGSASPLADTPVRLRDCSTSSPPSPQQVWVYRSDLTLQLLSSTLSTANGMCLDTASGAAGDPLVVRACRAINSAPYTQRWSFDDNGAYRSTTAGGSLGSVCINAPSQTVAQAINLAGCVGSLTSPAQAWIPSPAVGAGAAAPPQWISYYEFGRCLDVTNQNVNTDHLIDFPCKQDPVPANVAWNQKFSSPLITPPQTKGVGQIYTTLSSVNYCLTTPAALNGYVTVKVCGSVAAALQQWTVAGGDRSLSFSTKYTVVDSNGRCLGLADPVAGDQWSTIVAETCTGATEQKWNARPNLSAPTLQNTVEQ